MTAAVNNNQGNTIRTYAKMTLDFTFKRVFANESNKGALIAFLNRMIDGAKITDVQLLPTERLGMSSSDRKAVFDIFCRENDGTEYIVEMQCAKQKYFRDRALYYAGYPLVEQGRHALEEFVNKSVGQGGADKADRMNGFRWNYRLKPVIFIAILNFSLEHDDIWPDEKYISSYQVREDTVHEIMSDKLRFIFLELGRFNKDIAELSNMNEKWIYALKHMHEFDVRPENMDEDEFDVLFNLAKIANFAPVEINSYLEELLMENDYWNTIDYAKELAEEEGLAKGMAKGFAEGMERGLAEGKIESQKEIARRMLDMEVPLEQIVLFTSLSVEQIMALNEN